MRWNYPSSRFAHTLSHLTRVCVCASEYVCVRLFRCTLRELYVHPHTHLVVDEGDIYKVENKVYKPTAAWDHVCLLTQDMSDFCMWTNWASVCFVCVCGCLGRVCVFPGETLAMVLVIKNQHLDPGGNIQVVKLRGSTGSSQSVGLFNGEMSHIQRLICSFSSIYTHFILFLQVGFSCCLFWGWNS